MIRLAPQLITLLVCLLLVPLVVFLSLFAGWFVWKNVAVSWEAPVYLQYGDGMPPYAEIPLPSLVAQQPYEISLRLAIPATESNYALGNFMTTLTLSTPSNRTLTSIRRPSIALPARGSFWTSQPDIIDMTVPLFSSFAPGTSRILAKLELGRRDGWKSLGEGHGRELSVLSASLRGSIKLKGLRGLVTRFPFPSALISSVIFFLVSLLLLIALFIPALGWTPSPSSDFDARLQPQMMQTPRQREKGRAGLTDDSEDYDDRDEEEPWQSRRRSGSTSRSRLPLESDLDVKLETPSSVIPEAQANSSSRSGTPLYRRQSRHSQNLFDDGLEGL